MVDRDLMVDTWKNIKPKFKKEGRSEPPHDVEGEDPPKADEEEHEDEHGDEELPPPATEHTDVEEEEQHDDDLDDEPVSVSLSYNFLAY